MKLEATNSVLGAQAARDTSFLRLGIIGAGRMGITHLALAGSLPEVKVTAIAENSQMMVRALSRHRPDIELFDDYTRMFQNAKLDMVLIATPPDLHAAMVGSALDAGLSVFVEKPFTLHSEEAQKLTERSRAIRGTFQVGYVNRFNDVFMKTKKLLEENLLGRIFSFRCDMFGRTITRPVSSSSWRSKRKFGGGCLYEFGSHAIDLAVFFFGKPERVTGSCLVPIYSKEAEDIVRTNIIYPNGLTGSMTVNWSDESFRKPTNKIEILGEHGKIIADQHELKIYLNRSEGPFSKGWNTLYITDSFSPVPFYVRGNEFSRQIYHFAERAMDPNLINSSSFEDALITQEVIDMILADAGVER